MIINVGTPPSPDTGSQWSPGPINRGGEVSGMICACQWDSQALRQNNEAFWEKASGPE